MGNLQANETKSSKGKVKALMLRRGKKEKLDDRFLDVTTAQKKVINESEESCDDITVRADEVVNNLKNDKIVVTDSWQAINKVSSNNSPQLFETTPQSNSSSDSAFTDPLVSSVLKDVQHREAVDVDHVSVPVSIVSDFLHLPLNSFKLNDYKVRKDEELGKKLCKLGVSKISQISLDCDPCDRFTSENVQCVQVEESEENKEFANEEHMNNTTTESSFYSVQENTERIENVTERSKELSSDFFSFNENAPIKNNTKKNSLDIDIAAAGPPKYVRHMSVPESSSNISLKEDSLILKKVASLTLDKATLDSKIAKPKFVPEKLDFKLYEKFEGHMLVNWYLSEFGENHHFRKVLQGQDLKLLAIQFCTHLLAAGVVKQIPDKGAPLYNIFKTDLMYYWTHSETPQSVPQTPGKFTTLQWPPTSPTISEVFYSPGYIDISSSRSSHQSTTPSDTEMKLSAKNVEIISLEDEIKRLKQDIEKYKTLTEIQELTAKTVTDFSSPLVESKDICEYCDKCREQQLSNKSNFSFENNCTNTNFSEKVDSYSQTEINKLNRQLSVGDVKYQDVAVQTITISTSFTENNQFLSVSDNSEIPKTTTKIIFDTKQIQTDCYEPLSIFAEKQDTTSSSVKVPVPPPLPSFSENSLTALTGPSPFPQVGPFLETKAPLSHLSLSGIDETTQHPFPKTDASPLSSSHSGTAGPPPPPPFPFPANITFIPPPVTSLTGCAGIIPPPLHLAAPPPPPPLPLLSTEPLPSGLLPPPPPPLPPSLAGPFFSGLPPPPPPPSSLEGPPPSGISPPPPPPGMGIEKSIPPVPINGPMPFPVPPSGGWNPQKSLLRKTQVIPINPMKPLYWTRIVVPENKNLSDSVDDIDTPTVLLWSHIDEIPLDNLNEFTELFSRQVVVRKQTKKKQEATPKTAAVKLLDSKRSQNVGILAQSLHVEFSEIENAIYNFDTSVVSLEALQQIYEARATPEELEQIKSHINANADIPLDKPEMFLHDLSEISNFAERIFCFMFQVEFDDSISTVENTLTNIKTTCNFLVRSSSLKEVLSIILTLGNYMNGGHMTRGQADGFGLEILSKLKDVKSTKDSQTTLLHFIVRTYMSKIDNPLILNLQLPVPEPEDIRRASTVNFDDVCQDLQKLENRLNACEKKIQKVIGESTPENLEPFKEKMSTFMENAHKRMCCQKEHLEECKTKFIHTMNYYHFKPKSGPIESFPPNEFFELWLQFCKDFKDIWKKETIRLEKAKKDELRKREKENSSQNVSIKKRENGLKSRVERLKQKLK